MHSMMLCIPRFPDALGATTEKVKHSTMLLYAEKVACHPAMAVKTRQQHAWEVLTAGRCSVAGACGSGHPEARSAPPLI